MVLFCALVFAQNDLTHTVFSSYAILHGHVVDFYDFNQPIMVGNDYLILLYLVLAIWMSPVFFFGLSTSQDEYQFLLANSAELLWAKLGLALLFVALAFLIQRIATKYFADAEQNRIKWIVLTSPFAMLAVFMMGQYDVIGLLLVALGFEAWLAKRYWAFVAYFALALSFKYLAIAIFIPLVLVGARNLRQAASWIALAVIPIGLQIGLGLTNSAYRANASLQPMKLLLPDLGSPISIALRILVLLLAVVVGLWLLRKKYADDAAQMRFGLLAVVASLTCLFIAVRWNPQWLLYLVPFWALLGLQIEHRRLQILAESLGFVGLVWMLANPWMNNVDDSMALRGAVSQFLPDRVLRLNDFYSADLLMIGVILVHLAIVAPIVIRVWELFLERKNGPAKDSGARRIGNEWLLRPVAFIVALIVPVSLCFITPPAVAKMISNSVELNSLTRMPLGLIHHKKLELSPGESLTETLVIPIAKLRAIQVDLSTGGQRVSGVVTLEALAGKKLVGNAAARLDAMKDSSFPGFSGWLPISFAFTEDLELEGKTVEFKFTNRTENSISIWIDDVRPESVDIKMPSGEEASGSIVMTFLMAKEERLGN